jgi:guanylate kinase
MSQPDHAHQAEHDRRRLPTDTDDGMLLVISGPSGVGKTTITRAVERATPGAVFSVSATTRAKTDADVDGVDYHFVSEQTFDDMVRADAFLEHAGVFAKRYGTPRAWVDEQLARGRLVILEIDVEGAKQVKAKLPGAFSIFILPPSEHELLRRLRSRKREAEEQIQRRFAAAQREIAEAHRCGVYDLFITNTVLDEAIDRARAAVAAERARRRRDNTPEHREHPA